MRMLVLNLRKKYQELLQSIPANYYPLIDSNKITLYDLPEDAPLITFQFHNQYAGLSKHEKMQMVNDMLMGATNAE